MTITEQLRAASATYIKFQGIYIGTIKLRLDQVAYVETHVEETPPDVAVVGLVGGHRVQIRSGDAAKLEELLGPTLDLSISHD